MYTMEDYKYLPPKYSYALKDLATDLGVFERADIQSLISGNSTNYSLTTASGFNGGFNATEKSLLDSFGQKKDIPLSPIKEQRGKLFNNNKSLQSPHANNNQSVTYQNKNQSNSNQTRFKNPVYNEIGPIHNKNLSMIDKKRSKKVSPRHERGITSHDKSSISNQLQSPFNNGKVQRNLKDRISQNRQVLPNGSSQRFSQQQQTTINNNNIVINIDLKNENKLNNTYSNRQQLMQGQNQGNTRAIQRLEDMNKFKNIYKQNMTGNNQRVQQRKKFLSYHAGEKLDNNAYIKKIKFKNQINKYDMFKSNMSQEL